jgi:hypothetical protein
MRAPPLVHVRVGDVHKYDRDGPRLSLECSGHRSRGSKGDKPADLPVMQPTKFEFAINLGTARTARALGNGATANPELRTFG